jgi:solute carrier family 13 (sodium-dependent dicarboxylate transporter), member 2/3/5
MSDALDLSSFKVEKLPTKKDSPSEKAMKYAGFPLGIAVFLAIYLMPAKLGLSVSAQTVLAIFATGLVWWITAPFPNYLTSLLVVIALVFLDSWPEERVLGMLGLDITWLNVAAFALSSALVASGIAKRAALWLISKFGHTHWGALAAFIIMNVLLAAMIPSTTARAAMMLPLIMMAGRIYGSEYEKPNNFMKSLMLQNLHAIDGASTGFLTGSNAHIIAAMLIFGMTGKRIYYFDWFAAAFPVAIVALLFSWVLGPKVMFRMKKEERVPQLDGGIDRVREELKKLGPISAREIKAIVIFAVVVLMWMTDRFHFDLFGFQITATMAAVIGATIAFLPKIGIIKWNEADIPWHLLIFSVGAYASGFALEESGAARWFVQGVFDVFNIKTGISFMLLYVIVIAVCAYSHLIFTSKTMRTIIFIPFIVSMAQTLGFDPLSLALPACFTISWVIGLPISSKPAVMYFATGQYTAVDQFKYGIAMTTIVVILLIVAGFTWFSLLGITPGL